MRPYAQILNQSTWTIYADDLDPERSDAELLAFLLIYGDRLAQLGEVTLAPVHLAPYWFERSDDERRRFAAAAVRSQRPDAALLRAVAEALPWLRELRHSRLRPPRKPGGHRPVPGTGLLVPRALEKNPEALVETARAVATTTLETFYARWREPSGRASGELCDWLAAEVPPVLVTTGCERVVWDPAAPDPQALVRELARAGEAAVRDVQRDLGVLAEHTRRFLEAVADPNALPLARPDTAQSGYTYAHPARRLLVYDLDEPSVERRLGPAIPYAREMLGARALHEWAHVAVDAGWVPRAIADRAFDTLGARLADELDGAIAYARRAARESTARSLHAPGDGSPGRRLCAIFQTRLPDYQANLLATRFWNPFERETYVLQNVRPLRVDRDAPDLWRALVRYLFEFQYLAFSSLSDGRAYFLSSTGFAGQFLAPGILDEARFDALCAAAGALCRAHAVDESRFRF